MQFLRKSLAEVSISDLESLIESETRETNELEFKGTLPFKPQKGHPETADRWIEKGDKVGEFARDEILAELIAFANADGGTLVLGLHETKDEPRRAERLEALPNCEGLARRLLDAAEDVVEPRFPMVASTALPCGDDGAGYVLLRVGKSLTGPHRLRTTREFYVRRGERAAKMDVREIKDLTLNLARTGDRVETKFSERRNAAIQMWNNISTLQPEGNRGPLVVRVAALPLTPVHAPNLTSRRDLWWFAKSFDLTVGDHKQRPDYPTRDFNDYVKPRLRAFECGPAFGERGTQRYLRDDGLVEFTLLHPPSSSPNGDGGSRVFFNWIASLVVGTLCQIEWLRGKMALDTVQYGLEITILGRDPLRLLIGDDPILSNYGTSFEQNPMILPRLQVNSPDEFDQILTATLLDASNAFGQHWEIECSVPWPDLLKA